MKKCLIILAAVLLPAALSAQSALHQLESMAGMSIHDVNVPDPGDPVPVDPDPEVPGPEQGGHQALGFVLRETNVYMMKL